MQHPYRYVGFNPRRGAWGDPCLSVRLPSGVEPGRAGLRGAQRAPGASEATGATGTRCCAHPSGSWQGLGLGPPLPMSPVPGRATNAPGDGSRLWPQSAAPSTAEQLEQDEVSGVAVPTRPCSPRCVKPGGRPAEGRRVLTGGWPEPPLPGFLSTGGLGPVPTCSGQSGGVGIPSPPTPEVPGRRQQLALGNLLPRRPRCSANASRSRSLVPQPL